MRRMRAPLILLILVYFFSTLAMVLVPGMDPDGNSFHMSFLDAAYFIAILQSTIGFGEIPFQFTAAQRLLVYLLLLPNVVAWLYSIGTLLRLILDKQFQAAFDRNRFARQVRGLKEPFYIVCGFGDTGAMIVSGLLARGIRAVVIELDESSVQRMMLEDEYARVPALAGNPTDHHMLKLAGLQHASCNGVIAATHDDDINLTIAITIKLLQPELRVLARSENQRISDNMASFGTHTIVDPYRIFAERLSLALSSPIKYLVQDWLISVPGSRLRDRVEPPAGNWIVCGSGRFGVRMIAQLQASKLSYTVVDKHTKRLTGHEHSVLGRGTEAHTLAEAGVATAVGIIAATANDIDNLSIIMTARQMNPSLFVVVRQSQRQNQALFDAAGADLIARRSMIIARRILSVVTTPLLQSFLEHLLRSEDSFAESTAARLQPVLHERAPNIWLLELRGETAENLRFALTRAGNVCLEHITHSSRSEEYAALDCVCLSLERGAQRFFLPAPDTPLQVNDRLLFAGRDHARMQMLWTLHDSHSLLSNVTGKKLPRGALWRWLSG